METPETAVGAALTRRRLMLRDSLAFISLALVTIALFAVTLFLFRSFTGHRAVLAQRWLSRGKTALGRGQPAQAVNALQVTLDYAPDDRAAKFLLARALAAAGHEEEADNYLTELWQTEPGSGLLNLQLARVAVKRGEQQQAINAYRAAIYGTWEGDGVDRRREVRLELARYLLAENDPDAARAELLVAGGNVSGNAQADLTIAGLLEQLNDHADARRLYLRAAEDPAHRAGALAAAGQIAFRGADFVMAQKFFTQALDAGDRAGSAVSHTDQMQIADELHLIEQILILIPSADLPATERVRRILRAREIARAGLDTCRKNPAAVRPEIADLSARWSARDALPGWAALLHSIDRQNASIALNERTALLTGRFCSSEAAGSSTEDHALLLIAQASKGPAS